MNTASVEIVQLPPEDWQAYRKIRLEALQNDPQAFGSSYQETLTRPDAYWQGRLAEAAQGTHSWLLFARENGVLVGTIGAFLNDAQNEAEIIAVYVTPAKRGRGIARALLERILQEVQKVPTVRKAILGVNRSQAAALALYQSFGFQIVEEMNARMGDGKSYDEYLMERHFP
jgi:ribosomal protein S18 acetylase RimI-like enzyme